MAGEEEIPLDDLARRELDKARRAIASNPHHPPDTARTQAIATRRESIAQLRTRLRREELVLACLEADQGRAER